MSKLILIIILTIMLNLQAESKNCDKQFDSCRAKCLESSNVECLLKCYQTYDSCKRD